MLVYLALYNFQIVKNFEAHLINRYERAKGGKNH